MAVIQLSGRRREAVGKGGARKARTRGEIPAVLYGHGVGPIPVLVNARDFETALRHKSGNPIINLAVDGGEYASLVRDVQYDPVTHDILHLDFHHISLTEEVTVEVKVHLTGIPVGVKEGGGILEGILREVEVRCLPTVIPAAIDVDVTALQIGDSVHVRDLAVSDVTILNDPDDTIATVVPPTVIEEKPAEGVEAEAAAAAVEGEAEPEVIAKGKKDEEAAGEKKPSEKGEKKEK